MALVANDPAHRAEQMIMLTDQLTLLIERETALIEAREPPLTGEAGEEKARLANLYRQEMTRIAAQRDLVAGVPPKTLAALRASTVRFRAALVTHERALTAVKEICEGIVHAIAEEVANVKAGPRAYGASGGYIAPPTSNAAAFALNKTA